MYLFDKSTENPLDSHAYLYVDSDAEIYQYYTVSGTIGPYYASWLSRTDSLPSTHSLVNFVVYNPEIHMIETPRHQLSSLLESHIPKLCQVVRNRAKLKSWEAVIRKVLEMSPYQVLVEALETNPDKVNRKFLAQTVQGILKQYESVGKVRIPFYPSRHYSGMGILEYPITQQVSEPILASFESKKIRVVAGAYRVCVCDDF